MKFLLGAKALTTAAGLVAVTGTFAVAQTGVFSSDDTVNDEIVLVVNETDAANDAVVKPAKSDKADKAAKPTGAVGKPETPGKPATAEAPAAATAPPAAGPDAAAAAHQRTAETPKLETPKLETPKSEPAGQTIAAP
jgi:hypothetical protein